MRRQASVSISELRVNPLGVRPTRSARHTDTTGVQDTMQDNSGKFIPTRPASRLRYRDHTGGRPCQTARRHRSRPPAEVSLEVTRFDWEKKLFPCWTRC